MTDNENVNKRTFYVEEEQERMLRELCARYGQTEASAMLRLCIILVHASPTATIVPPAPVEAPPPRRRRPKPR